MATHSSILGTSLLAHMVKNLSANAEDTRDADAVTDSGKSPGEGTGSPFQYSCLENPMDRGAGRLQSRGHVELDTTE